MIGRRVAGGNGAGLLIGSADAEATSAVAFVPVAGGVVVETGLGAGSVTLESFRTEEGTSGRGANSATSASMSRRLRPLALASTA